MTSQAQDVTVPKRKPGLWEITTVATDVGMSTIKACIGDDDKIATPDDSGACSEPKAKRSGVEDITVDVVCKRKYGKEIMSTTYTGDFQSRYHAIMKITYDPPDGVKNMGVIIDGKYLGPDCKDETKAP
jgi:hypothetical protein